MAGYFLKIALLLLALRAADAGSQNFTKFTKAEEKFWNFAVNLYNHLKPEFENVTCPESPAANQEKLSHRAKSDPDITNNATQLIESKGFVSEEHYVTTKDGYILLVLRIYPRNQRPTDRSKLPIYLQHGLLSSSDCFVNNLRNESLAFILGDLGYDVWLGNVRGNRYSSRHVKMLKEKKKFWEWSFDEMGKYDMPAIINYVLEVSGHKKLHFIGHSQGNTNLISAVIHYGKEFAQKIDKYIALAPAIFVGKAKSSIRYLSNAAHAIKTFWDLFENGDFFSHDGFGKFAQNFCPKYPWICEEVLFTLVGPDCLHYNYTRIPVYFGHAPAGTSTRNIVHWAQQFKAGNHFRFYDFGSFIDNLIHYGQFHPPEYDLSKFTVPTYMFLGGLDWMVVPEDGRALAKVLPNVQTVKYYPKINHVAFVWGYDIANTIYRDIIDIIES